MESFGSGLKHFTSWEKDLAYWGCGKGGGEGEIHIVRINEGGKGRGVGRGERREMNMAPKVQ